MATVLAVLVAYVVLALPIPALRLSARGGARIDLAQRGMQIDYRLTRALKSTPRCGVTVASGSAGEVYVSVHPLVKAVADSKQLFDGSVRVFQWAEGCLRERAVTLSGPTLRAEVPSPAWLTEKFLQAAERWRVNGVSEFSLSKGSGPSVDFKVQIGEGKEVLSFARTVYLANGMY